MERSLVRYPRELIAVRRGLVKREFTHVAGDAQPVGSAKTGWPFTGIPELKEKPGTDVANGHRGKAASLPPLYWDGQVGRS